jgi:hypothetical protein
VRRPIDADDAYLQTMLNRRSMKEDDPRFWNGVVFVLGFLFGMAAVGLPALFMALAT